MFGSFALRVFPLGPCPLDFPPGFPSAPPVSLPAPFPVTPVSSGPATLLSDSLPLRPLPLEYISCIWPGSPVDEPDPVPLPSGQNPSDLGPVSVRLLFGGSGCHSMRPDAAITLAFSVASLSQVAHVLAKCSHCLRLAAALSLSQSTTSICLCLFHPLLSRRPRGCLSALAPGAPWVPCVAPLGSRGYPVLPF